MSNNGYRPPYRQGPPPGQSQQQLHYDQYDQMGRYSGQPGRVYDQQGQDHSQYDNGQSHDYQAHQQNYNDAQWNDRQYQDNHYHDRYDQYGDVRSQHDIQDPGQQRTYQYEDRYRTNALHGPHTQQRQRKPPPMSMQPNNVVRDGAPKQNKARERILKDPDSPKTAAWDNPFPTFPSKKKSEPRKPETEAAQATDSKNPGNLQDRPRPSTSHSSRQHEDPVRPHTSHSQRHFEPLNESSFDHRTPLDPAPPLPRLAQERFQQTAIGDYPPRPMPRRAMTGPAPPQPNGDFGHERFHDHPNNGQREQLSHDTYPPQRYADDNAPQQRLEHNGALQTPVAYQSDLARHQRRSSDQSYRKPLSGDVHDYDSTSYRGVSLTKKRSPDMPNFDALPDNATEKAEDPLSFRQTGQTQVYSKPTYQRSSLSQPDDRARRSPVNGNELVSPLAQFSFNIPSTDVQNHSPATIQHLDQRGLQYNKQGYTGPQRPPQPTPNQQIQYPARSQGTSTGVPPASSDQYLPSRQPRGYQPVRPFRPGLAQSPPSTTAISGGYAQEEQQGYEYNEASYDATLGQEDVPNRPDMPFSQASYQNDPSRQGYDTRIQPRQGFVPLQQQQAFRQGPLRPSTSNSSSSAPFTDRPARQSSDSYRTNSMQNPDSLPAHPAPFRPGLLQSTPAPPQPPPQAQQASAISHQRAPSGPKPAAEAEAPVTIRELNTLRENYKAHPDDYALGLRFAKRLVEAAKTLASENGRADPKQTAKNRERYILDAHKIVKRLCGVGYAEAMFYFADCYGQGLLGLEPDAKEAFSLYQSAAKLGHAQAAYRVAVCCELGSEEGGGTRRDPLKSVQWYKRAASMGDTPAMYKMGMIQLKGLLGQPKNPREAISWLKRAAERADAENPHALHELGSLYENALSTDIIIKDEKYALQLFQQAAELGYKYSQFRLGSAFEYGLLGLPIDPRMSIAYYSRAAKQGEHQAEFALSGWYLTGSGPPPPGEQPLLQQSDTEAYLWARKAASSGLAKAEYAMGYYTEVGIGVTSNIEEAKRWYYRAAAQNHPKARERLEDLKRGGQRMQKTRVSRSNVGKHNEGECTVM